MLNIKCQVTSAPTCIYVMHLVLISLVFGFVGTDHLRTKIIINDEILDQVSQFTYLGCIISY